MRKAILVFMVVNLGLAACTGLEGPTPTASPPVLVRVLVRPASSELLMLESYPVQVVLHITGELPDPCGKLGWAVSKADAQGAIRVNLYVEERSDLACIQVVQPFDERIPLGSFVRGTFNVLVNSDRVGEFTLP